MTVKSRCNRLWGRRKVLTMTRLASPPSVWRIPAMIVLLIFVSSCAFGGSSPVNAESVSCVNGRLQDDGLCACDNCWKGERCDEYAKPRFREPERIVDLNSPDEEKIIFEAAQALDIDDNVCLSQNACPCRDVQFSLLSGNDDGLFTIDTQTGEVRVSEDLRSSSLPMSEEGHMLSIQAYDAHTGSSDTMKLLVWPLENKLVPDRIVGVVGEELTAGGHPHHIHKRSAIVLPDNVTFTLNKTGDSASVTEMRVGTKVSFQLQILFPQTTTDMLVELFAPDNESIVMMLCDVQVQKTGDNLEFTGDGKVVMDSQNMSTRYYDRAIIDFGNVTNKFTITDDEAESSIFITWDAVMIHNDNTEEGAVYWVSAGAEYNYENEVWVGQASFTANLDDTSSSFDNSTFNLTGPSTMKIGTSAVFKLDMYITKPSVALSIDTFAPYNIADVMSICDMQVVDTAINYQCGFNPEEHMATFHPDTNTRGSGRARLELGTVTNKGARESGNLMENNRITVDFVVHLYDDASYVGTTYKVGAAVEIGSQQIWAGQIDVEAVAYSSGLSFTPSWEVTKAGSGKVSTVAPLLMTLDISIPQNTAGKYALEILAPFDSAAVFQLCAVRVVGVGTNLACMNTDLTPMYTSRGNPMYTDRIYADMGSVTNVGPWGWQPYNLTNSSVVPPDVIRLEFLVKATNHTLATEGSAHSVTAGLFIDDNRLLVGTFPVEVEAAAEVPNITTETTPDWEMAWVGGGDGNVRVGGAGQFLFTITTKSNTVYSPFDLEALMPNSTGAPEVALCKVQVHSVGTNLPCVLASALNASVVYTSSIDSGSGEVIYDRGVLNLPSICNFEVVNDTVQDQLAFRVGFMLRSDAGLANGTELWPSVGVMFSPYKMYVGQIKTWARTDLSDSSENPYVTVIKSSGDVPVGYFALYNVLIKTVPGNSAPYTLNVSVSTPGLSVCSVKVLEIGDNMPCTSMSTLEAIYERVDGINVKGSLDFGSVPNAGTGTVAANETVDDNTIVVEVMIGVSPDIAVIGDGSSHSFSVEVNDGSSAENPAVPVFTAVHDQSSFTGTTAANVSSLEVNVAPVTDMDNSTDVVLGQSKRLQMCAWTYPGITTKMAFNMMTPLDNNGALEAVYIGVSNGGKNVPCAGSCKAGAATYQTRVGSTYTDIATVDLGYVINNNFVTDDPDANKVCVDGVFRVLQNGILAPGATVQVSASLNVDDVEINIIQQTLTIKDSSTFTDTYPDNATLINGTIISVNSTVPDPLSLKPGEKRTLPFVVTVPPYVTSTVTMDLQMDVDQSACLTYQALRLISVGRNLRGFGKEYDLQCTPTSSNSTSQMDDVQCSFGIVTNPGMSERCDDLQTDDNAMYLELDFQVADCPKAEKDANLTASLGLKVAGYIAILNFPVMVLRDGSEAPVYNITATANSTGDTMYIDYDIRLDNTSQAEVHNASLIIMPPPYLTCNTLVSSSGVRQTPPVDASASRMIIDLGSIFFTDVFNLLVLCEANSNSVPSGVSGHFTVVKHQLSGDVIPRAGSTLPSTTVWSDLDFVNVTANTVSDSGVPCSSGALGLKDANIIFDCQISASVSSLTLAANGRKDGSGWTPYVREGELKGQRYFQVYFANKMLVDRVEVNQLAVAKATEIKLAYSNDGRSFLNGEAITLAGQASEIVHVPNPQSSQVLRVYVTKDDVTDQQVKLTFEFYGCATSIGGPSGRVNVCAAAGAAVPAQISSPLFFHRSFLTVSTGVVYVCDGVVKTQGTVYRCFVSPDGATWQPLDPRVAAMVGHDPETNRLFALSDDRVTYMSSGDAGLTWASTHSDVVTSAQAQPAYVTAKNVPWTNAMGHSDPKEEYQNGNWGASNDFLKKNEGGSWNKKLKWDCC